jgi:hypothetical protein
MLKVSCIVIWFLDKNTYYSYMLIFLPKLNAYVIRGENS